MSDTIQTFLTGPSFESRIRPQSRPSHTDERGNVLYEHNSPLQIGETVEPILGGPHMTVIKSDYRDLISRTELVKVVEELKDGCEGPAVEMAVSAVRRVNRNS
jgi:hypothetical protein